MANAGGRLTGTLLSRLGLPDIRLQACLWLFSMLFILIAALLSFKLHNHQCAEN